MAKLIKIPHEVHESTCSVNGLFDVLTWQCARYDYFLLPIIGGMASFAYLKFKMAKLPTGAARFGEHRNTLRWIFEFRPFCDVRYVGLSNCVLEIRPRGDLNP
jgi:hypothetical protein